MISLAFLALFLPHVGSYCAPIPPVHTAFRSHPGTAIHRRVASAGRTTERCFGVA